MQKFIKEIIQQQDTAFYIYDLDAMADRVQSMKKILGDKFHMHFAMKSNFNPKLLKRMCKCGLGVDVVSAGEMQVALEAGFAAKDIVFSGVGKTIKEINAAFDAGVGQLNIESEAEFLRIQKIAKERNIIARVAFRVNPDVNPETHPYICTGLNENKFGVEFHIVEKYLRDKKLTENIEVVGLTLHIGSQILDPAVFREAIQKTLALYREFPGRFESIDVGGGLGIDYHSDDLTEDTKRFQLYADIIKDELGNIPKVIMEPGRFLVGRFGKLVSPVQYIKNTSHKNFVITSTGMHHLMRPALYQAYHRIDMIRTSAAEKQIYDIVGPICESSDVLGRDRSLPKDICDSDWLVVHDVGAYGYVMANQYNLHEMPKEFIIENGSLI